MHLAVPHSRASFKDTNVTAYNMTEREIIEGLKGNDQLVFDRVFDEYFPQMQLFAMKLTGEQEEARDIVIKAFYSLWGLRTNFDTITNIRAFLYITIRNNCLNYFRYQERQEAGRKAYESRLSGIEDDKSADLQMMQTELMQLIYQKVEELPKKCKEIFKLTYFEGLHAGEIAKKLNISTSTVTTQRSIAIKYLRAVLSAEDFLVLLLLLNSGLQVMPHIA
jgi:RNA polymerase sigma-70 factor (family 1)